MSYFLKKGGALMKGEGGRISGAPNDLKSITSFSLLTVKQNKYINVTIMYTGGLKTTKTTLW